MIPKQPKSHSAAEFDLDVLESELDMFRWFLLCYLFGKPIRSESAVATWELFIENKLDTPWAISSASWRSLSEVLCAGGYRRYDRITATGLKKAADQLIKDYEGSLFFMLESSSDEGEFSKRLQRLHGVGPKVTEIFTGETEEHFAQRVE